MLPAQVRVPQAELQELLPAGRLLSSATRLSPKQYEQAKAAFLQQVGQAGLAAQVRQSSGHCCALCSPRLRAASQEEGSCTGSFVGSALLALESGSCLC